MGKVRMACRAALLCVVLLFTGMVEDWRLTSPDNSHHHEQEPMLKSGSTFACLSDSSCKGKQCRPSLAIWIRPAVCLRGLIQQTSKARKMPKSKATWPGVKDMSKRVGPLIAGSLLLYG